MSRSYATRWQQWVPDLQARTTADLEAYYRHCTAMLNGMCGATFEDGMREPARREWLAKRQACVRILAARAEGQPIVTRHPVLTRPSGGDHAA